MAAADRVVPEAIAEPVDDFAALLRGPTATAPDAAHAPDAARATLSPNSGTGSERVRAAGAGTGQLFIRDAAQSAASSNERETLPVSVVAPVGVLETQESDSAKLAEEERLLQKEEEQQQQQQQQQQNRPSAGADTEEPVGSVVNTPLAGEIPLGVLNLFRQLDK